MQNRHQPQDIKMESHQIQLTVLHISIRTIDRIFFKRVVCSFQVDNSFPLSLDVITDDTSKTAGEQHKS